MVKVLKKTYSLKEIAKAIDGVVIGNEDLEVERLASPRSAKENDVAIAVNKDEIEKISNSQAKAFIVPSGVESLCKNHSCIVITNPRLAFMMALRFFHKEPKQQTGIDSRAFISETAIIGENVSIGPWVYVGDHVVIGDDSKILPNVYIGYGTNIGRNALIYHNVTLGEYITIGDNFIAHPGVCIGADGFSYVTDTPSNVEQAKTRFSISPDGKEEQQIFKVHSVGSVIIGNNVEIGANSTVDRGTIENTSVGDNTKIDNQVMVGHNCTIGKNCIIVAQVGISGSVVIGDRTTFAGQSGVADHVTIGKDVVIMAKTGVTKNVKDASIMAGLPAQPLKVYAKEQSRIKKIPVIEDQLKDLYKQIDDLKLMINNDSRKNNI